MPRRSAARPSLPRPSSLALLGLLTLVGCDRLSGGEEPGPEIAKAEAKTDNSLILTPNMQVTMSSPSGVPSTSTNNTPVLLTVVDRNTVATTTGARSYRVGN